MKIGGKLMAYVREELSDQDSDDLEPGSGHHDDFYVPPVYIAVGLAIASGCTFGLFLTHGLEFVPVLLIGLAWAALSYRSLRMARRNGQR